MFVRIGFLADTPITNKAGKHKLLKPPQTAQHPSPLLYQIGAVIHNNIWSLWRQLLTVMLAFFVGVQPALAAEEAALKVVIPQGSVGRVTISVAPGDSAPWASFRKQLVHFRPLQDGRFLGLIGVDMESDLGQFNLEVKVLRGGDSRVIAQVPVQIVAGKFGVQRLTLPDRMVDLDDTTLQRVRKEKREVGQLWRQGQKSKVVWQETWRMPVEGTPSGSFGKRRFINDKPRSPHNGEDIPAPAGTLVVAPNSGTVRLAKERYFGGQTVFLEHGGGLFTFYMHLSEILVTDGTRVDAGDPIGKVGASGRATGPHLHWGGRWNKARINPLTLVNALPVVALPGRGN